MNLSAPAVILDPKTIAAMIVALTFLSAIMLALARTQARGMHGVGWWAWAELSLALGLVCNLLQTSISPWLAFVVGNTLLVTGLALAVNGIKLYKNEPPARALMAGVIGVSFLYYLWFGIIEPSASMRVTYTSGVLALLAAIAARHLLVPIGQPLRIAYWITGSAFAVYAMAMGTRALVIGVFDNGASAFTPTMLNMMTFAVSGFALLAATFGFILMITYRMAVNMEKLASIDALTGALNRRSLEQRATHLAAQGTGRSIGVIMLDIDHFKLVNDRYGHPAGDYVLQEVTTLGRAQLRERDLFARMGGEEFCVVLAEGDEDSAVRIAERIRQACSKEPMVFNNSAIDVHLSAGVAAGKVTGGALEELIGEADLALYEAKQTGRDKVVRWSSIAAHSRPIPARRIAVPQTLAQPN